MILAKPGIVLPPTKSAFRDVAQTSSCILSRSRTGPLSYVKVVKQTPLKPGTYFMRITNEAAEHSPLGVGYDRVGNLPSTPTKIKLVDCHPERSLDGSEG